MNESEISVKGFGYDFGIEADEFGHDSIGMQFIPLPAGQWFNIAEILPFCSEKIFNRFFPQPNICCGDLLTLI